MFSPKIGNKTRMSTLITCIQYSTERSSHCNRERKVNEGIQIGNKEIELSLLSDDTILYVENCKESTKKQLGLISEFTKVIRYRINTQK